MYGWLVAWMAAFRPGGLVACMVAYMVAYMAACMVACMVSAFLPASLPASMPTSLPSCWRRHVQVSLCPALASSFARYIDRSTHSIYRSRKIPSARNGAEHMW